jgi:methionine biosynthesis protein MetW
MDNLSPNLQTVVRWIKPNSRVLDLGCGSGTLLSILTEQKNIQGLGLEIDPDNILQCVSRGLSVVEHDLNKGLSRFDDASFDTVIMTQTLQAIERPDLILDEMLRLGKDCIVTFPNFGHWQPRSYLLFKGRMPVSDYLPYSWYDSPNIHFFTVNDFETLLTDKGYRILNKRMVAQKKGVQTQLCQFWPNLFAETAVYHLAKF